MLQVKAYPTTVMSVYGNAKTTEVGPMQGGKADAFFEAALASLSKDTMLPCAIMQSEVDHFKEQQGHGAVLIGQTMADIRQLLPVNNSSRVKCIAFIGGAAGEGAKVLQF